MTEINSNLLNIFSNIQMKYTENNIKSLLILPDITDMNYFKNLAKIASKYDYLSHENINVYLLEVLKEIKKYEYSTVIIFFYNDELDFYSDESMEDLALRNYSKIEELITIQKNKNDDLKILKYFSLDEVIDILENYELVFLNIGGFESKDETEEIFKGL